MKLYQLLAACVLASFSAMENASAQNIAINTTGNPANASALLDVDASPGNNLGILIPRVALSATNNNAPIGAGITTSLLVYNTATAGVAPNNVLPGFYYWNGSLWVSLSGGTGGKDWSLLGNYGTVDGTNFLGSIDDVPITIKVNNQQVGRIEGMGSNLFLGQLAGVNNVATYNSAFGWYALNATTNGGQNTAIGPSSLRYNTTGNENTAVGYGSLVWNVAGRRATAVGTYAMLYANDQMGSYVNCNVALGYAALQGSNIPANNTGNFNTALGYQALFVNTSGNNNTAIGYTALDENTLGIFNTGIGSEALTRNTSGNYNTACGKAALENNTIGLNNTAVGRSALWGNSGGDYNTAIGESALLGGGGDNNTAIGCDAIHDNDGDNNTAVGRSSLYSNAAGNNATAIGYFAMRYSNSSGVAFTNYNVAVGYESLRGSTTASANTGNYNTALGYQTLLSNTTGSENTALGNSVLYSNISGTGNTAGGNLAMSANTGGSFNTAFGAGSLNSNIAAAFNSAFGYGALSANTYGQANVAVGCEALFAQSYVNGNTTWLTENVAVGYQVLLSNNPTSSTNGYRNTGVGSRALSNNSTGSFNTAIGYQTLTSATVALNNTAVGYLAGTTTTVANALTTGSNNTFIGYNTGFASATQRTNATAIGYNAKVDASNALILGGTGADAVDVGIGTTAPAKDLEVSGSNATIRITDAVSNAPKLEFNRGANYAPRLYATTNGRIIYQISNDGFTTPVDEYYFETSQLNNVFRSATDNTKSLGNATYRWTAVWAVNGTIQTSDKREKENITEIQYGLDDVMKLKPVSFNWISDNKKTKKLGLIAQDVLPVIKEVVSNPKYTEPEFVKDEQGNFVKNDNYVDKYGMNYTELIPVLIKSIQELNAKNESQQKEISELKISMEKFVAAK